MPSRTLAHRCSRAACRTDIGVDFEGTFRRESANDVDDSTLVEAGQGHEILHCRGAVDPREDESLLGGELQASHIEGFLTDVLHRTLARRRPFSSTLSRSRARSPPSDPKASSLILRG